MSRAAAIWLATVVTVLVRQLSAEAIALKYVSIYERSEESFFRISEYLDADGGERTAGRLFLRTNPDQRAGHYLAVTLNDEITAFPELATVQLEYFRPDTGSSLYVESFSFPQPAPETKEVWLGLTGEKAPPAQSHLTAWRITLLDAQGKPLAQRHSYLWEK